MHNYEMHNYEMHNLRRRGGRPALSEQSWQGNFEESWREGRPPGCWTLDPEPSTEIQLFKSCQMARCNHKADFKTDFEAGLPFHEGLALPSN